MDQDETWHGGRPRPRRHCVRLGPSPSPQLAQPPNFRPIHLIAAYVYRPSGQTVGWIEMPVATEYGGRARPRPHCVRWDPVHPERDTVPPSFRPMSVVAKRSQSTCQKKILWRYHNRTKHRLECYMTRFLVDVIFRYCTLFFVRLILTLAFSPAARAHCVLYCFAHSLRIKISVLTE